MRNMLSFHRQNLGLKAWQTVWTTFSGQETGVWHTPSVGKRLVWHTLVVIFVANDKLNRHHRLRNTPWLHPAWVRQTLSYPVPSRFCPMSYYNMLVDIPGGSLFWKLLINYYGYQIPVRLINTHRFSSLMNFSLILYWYNHPYRTGLKVKSHINAHNLFDWSSLPDSNTTGLQ